MPFFSLLKNINSLLDLTCATTLTVTKGVPVRQAAGVVTICATNVLDCIGVAAETHVSGGAATIKVWPAEGKEGSTMFKIANATIAATSAASQGLKLLKPPLMQTIMRSGSNFRT